MTHEELITGVDPIKAQLINQLDANDLKKLIVDFNYKKMLEAKMDEVLRDAQDNY